MPDSNARALRLRYTGTCSRCGKTLVRGVTAVWDKPAKLLFCLECAAVERPGVVTSLVLDAGTAGASAQREFERRSANRKAALKVRWGDRVGGWAAKLTDEPQSTRAWATGAAGEARLAAALEAVPGIRTLFDRRVPGTRGNLDAIVVGPGGIFVVDAKQYDGLVEVRDVGPFWRSDLRLYVGRRDRSGLADGLGWQVAAVMEALEEGRIDPLPPVTPVLCFVNAEWPLIRPPTSFRGVRLESERSIQRLITANPVFDPKAVEDFARFLAEVFPPS